MSTDVTWLFYAGLAFFAYTVFKILLHISGGPVYRDFHDGKLKWGIAEAKRQRKERIRFLAVGLREGWAYHDGAAMKIDDEGFNAWLSGSSVPANASDGSREASPEGKT